MDHGYTITSSACPTTRLTLPDNPDAGPFLVSATDRVVSVGVGGKRFITLLPGEQAYFEARMYPAPIAAVLLMLGFAPYRWITDHRF